jgi:ribosomal protein S12 methylthiotransferase accessory factor
MRSWNIPLVLSVRKKKLLPREHPGLEQLKRKTPFGVHLLALEPILVSPRFGIVKELKLFIPDPSEPSQPRVVQSILANHRYKSKDEHLKSGASGKGLTINDAQEGALGEAVERYSSLFWYPEEITYARRSELSGRSLDPNRLVLYRPEQYVNVPYRPYTEDATLGWARCHSLTNGEMIFVPALAIFLGYSAGSPEESIFGPTSNGLATGDSLHNAVFSAALEIIERDAFLVGWNHQLAIERWDPLTHPDPEFRKLLEVYRRRGVELELFQMPTDTDVGVFFALGVTENREELPTAVVGLGAHPNPVIAARKAFLEVGQIRLALRRRLRSSEVRQKMNELFQSPSLVKELEDHDLLYAHPGALCKFDFLRKMPITQSAWSVNFPERDLHWLTEHLAGLGHELIYFDLTPHDMRRLGLYTARAIIPDFQPIDFGYHQLRLGGERLHQLPYKLGRREKPASPGTLNPDPHPIA